MTLKNNISQNHFNLEMVGVTFLIAFWFFMHFTEDPDCQNVPSTYTEQSPSHAKMRSIKKITPNVTIKRTWVVPYTYQHILLINVNEESRIFGHQRKKKSRK